MASLATDFDILELILGDLASFAAGQPVSASPTIGGSKYTVSLVALPNGPVAPYTTISGSFFSVFIEAVTLGAEIAGGASAQVAIKEGNAWYGLSIGKAG